MVVVVQRLTSWNKKIYVYLRPTTSSDTHYLRLITISCLLFTLILRFGLGSLKMDEEVGRIVVIHKGEVLMTDERGAKPRLVGKAKMMVKRTRVVGEVDMWFREKVHGRRADTRSISSEQFNPSSFLSNPPWYLRVETL